ncbi:MULTISPECIES: hypothetical protein [unclassified Pseudoalteromonas]|uniref:hypothetical protein n=1 Tax=unclassified Pseudoalteromonas TaxID=194690 RepID=UPI0025B4171E|nr:MULTISPECIES: hypothetical protein [unclassified Pseudoalteromonas]MDN3378501.1 hypothetical protein [Pseudoalteromonas sp. APC 3893]MDN3387086.1 hypothetical protein [Pseudoalteromonas sp. APC 4017]
MSQAMPMAVNKVNTLVISTNVGALQKHIIVKVIGDVDIKAQLFSQGSAVNLEQHKIQPTRKNQLMWLSCLSYIQ